MKEVVEVEAKMNVVVAGWDGRGGCSGTARGIRELAAPTSTHPARERALEQRRAVVKAMRL